MYGNEAIIKQKPIAFHPLDKYVKQSYADRIKYTHNSVNNPKYPMKPKKIIPESSKIRFMVVGNFLGKEFLECTEIVNLFHRYKKNFEPPIIRGVTAIEWPEVWRDIKVRFGGESLCLQSEVAVFINGNILGGDKELKTYLQQNYTFNVTIDYYTKAVEEFLNRVRASGRSHAYMHIAIDGTYAGTFIFMLYTDITPVTTENFLRLCTLKKGGYSGTPIHRIVKDGWIQGGGYGLKTVKMPCENYIVPKDQRGVLCMANDGRNCDNSTQFFILLQPADWMAHKYVGFGQLIDGEETLRKLEALPTYYESPLNDVIIMDSGVLNLECHGIMPTVGTNEYVELHIEDLINLGETFYNELVERVFLEIKFREVARIHKEQKGEGSEETGIHETKRFIKNKKDMEEQLQKNKVEIEIEEANLEYDVEVYEPEEYSYKHVSLGSSSIVIKETKPYYVELTDVPYPGEKDSVFDFKRFLKGYYCLESDLETKKEEEPPVSEEKEDEKEKGDEAKTQESKEVKEQKSERSILKKSIVTIEEEKTVPVSLESSSISTYSFDFSLDSDEEEEIRSYLRLYVDRVSFAGDIVRQISKGGGKGRKLKRNVPTLDFLTKLRFSTSSKTVPKKVVITEPDLSKPFESDSRPKIKRRQTGFVHQQFDDNDDDDVDDDHEHDDDHDDDKYHGRRRVSKGGNVKIIPPGFKSIEETTAQKIARRQTGITPPGVEDYKPRESVLKRLYDDVIEDTDERVPTLKEFKPRSECKKKNTLLTYSPIPLTSTLSKDSGSIRSEDGRALCTEMITVQHGLERKISSDYVRTIEQGHKTKKSIRSVEYARTRPMLTVAEYQAKNFLYEQQQQKKKEEEEQLRLQLEQEQLLLIQLQQQRQKEEEAEQQRQQILQQLLLQHSSSSEAEQEVQEQEEEQQEQELQEEQEEQTEQNNEP